MGGRGVLPERTPRTDTLVSAQRQASWGGGGLGWAFSAEPRQSGMAVHPSHLPRASAHPQALLLPIRVTQNKDDPHPCHTKTLPTLEDAPWTLPNPLRLNVLGFVDLPRVAQCGRGRRLITEQVSFGLTTRLHFPASLAGRCGHGGSRM